MQVQTVWVCKECGNRLVFDYDISALLEHKHDTFDHLVATAPKAAEKNHIFLNGGRSLEVPL